MSNFRLTPVSAALVAAGIIASSGAFALGLKGIPSSSGVYAQGTFSPTAYMVISRNMYAGSPTEGATYTGGYISVLLKPAQTGWGYALTTGSSGHDVDDPTQGVATLSHTLTTGTTSCTATYVNTFDAAGTLSVSMKSVAATPSTATTTCGTAFANQTGLPAAFYKSTGSTDSKTFSLIY